MAKTSTPKAGAKFVYDGEAPLGVDAGRIAVGTEVTVREVVEAGTKGAHDDTEDAVVIEWEAPTLVHNENGVEVGYVTRAMSIGVDGRDFTVNGETRRMPGFAEIFKEA